MIEHRRLHGDQHRMHVRKVRRAGRELDLLCFGDERGLEHHAVGDVLARVGEMLAHEGVMETEPVGKNDGLAILFQRFGPVSGASGEPAW